MTMNQKKALYAFGSPDREATVNRFCTLAEIAPDPAVKHFFLAIARELNAPTTVADGGTVSVYTAMKADCPFKVSEAAETADAVWMNWQIQRSPAKWVYAGEGDTGVKVTAAAAELEADRYLWCMTGDWFNGFTLYNKYTKKQIAATAPAANNGANTLTLADSGTSRFALVHRQLWKKSLP